MSVSVGDVAPDFALPSDCWPHGAVAKQYGVFWESAGIATRGTFVIDRAGVIRAGVQRVPLADTAVGGAGA